MEQLPLKEKLIKKNDTFLKFIRRKMSEKEINDKISELSKNPENRTKPLEYFFKTIYINTEILSKINVDDECKRLFEELNETINEDEIITRIIIYQSMPKYKTYSLKDILYKILETLYEEVPESEITPIAPEITPIAPEIYKNIYFNKLYKTISEEDILDKIKSYQDNPNNEKFSIEKILKKINECKRLFKELNKTIDEYEIFTRIIIYQSLPKYETYSLNDILYKILTSLREEVSETEITPIAHETPEISKLYNTIHKISTVEMLRKIYDEQYPQSIRHHKKSKKWQDTNTSIEELSGLSYLGRRVEKKVKGIEKFNNNFYKLKWWIKTTISNIVLFLNYGNNIIVRIVTKKTENNPIIQLIDEGIATTENNRRAGLIDPDHIYNFSIIINNKQYFHYFNYDVYCIIKPSNITIKKITIEEILLLNYEPTILVTSPKDDFNTRDDMISEGRVKKDPENKNKILLEPTDLIIKNEITDKSEMPEEFEFEDGVNYNFYILHKFSNFMGGRRKTNKRKINRRKTNKRKTNKRINILI